MKRNLKIIRLYVISFLCFLGWWWMDSSPQLAEFLLQANRTRPDWKLQAFAFIGLIYYTLLAAAIAFFVITTVFLIREQLTKKSNARA